MTAQEFKYQTLIDKTLVQNEYMKFVAGISDPDLTSRICIELPAFCDPELLRTIESYQKNAANPDRLTFAVCFQDDDLETLHTLEHMPNCKVKHFEKSKAPGLCAARYECNKMVSDETYVLHTDSHMRVAKHWDVAMIKIWELCHDDMAVVSGYPLDYTCYLDRDVNDTVFTEQVRGEASPVGVVSHFDLHGTIRFRGGNLHRSPQNIRGLFISGGCVFAKAGLDKICPSDPEMFFTADEISMDIRYFTYGFHVYHPMFMPIWHLYGVRKDENKKPVERFNTKADDYTAKRITEDKRMRFLTGLLNEDMDLKGFGYGQKHTFQEFLTVSGINFAHHAVRGFAKTGHFFYSDDKLTDEEKRWHCYEMTEDREEHICDELALPPAPDEAYAGICVEIPCFKDKQIVTTVQSLLYQADHPERVHFAICLQEDDPEIVRALSMDMHVRYHLVNPKDAKGTGAARQMAAGLYCNEDYVLVTDAHMLAIKHWDTMMIRQLSHIPDKKAVLTAQVDDFGPCRGRDFWRGCFDMPYPVAAFGIDSFVHGEIPGLLYNNHYAGYLREKYKASTEPDVYVRTFGLTARYIFARGSFNDDVPFSETAVYRGDECMPSVIAFTKGYHAYTYCHGYLLHDSLSQRPRPLSATDRKKRLFESNSMKDLVTKGYTIDTELGQEQTIKDLEKFLGVDFESHRIYKRAYLAEPGTMDTDIESVGTHLSHDFYEERVKSKIYVVSVFNDETGYAVPEGESQYTAFKNSLLENADRPENVVVCAFKINDGRTYGFHVNQFMDSLDASENDIVLFVDGTVRFLPGWDDHLIQNFMGMNPHMVWSTNTYANTMTAPYKNPAVKITYNPVAASVITDIVESTGRFVHTKPVFLRGIIAMRLKIYHEIPFDPNISYADHCATYHLRLYTHGYDIWYDELSYLYRTRLIQHLDNITEPDKKLRAKLLGSLYEDYDGRWINYPYGHGRVRNLMSWYRQLGFIDTNRNAAGTALF